MTTKCILTNYTDGRQGGNIYALNGRHIIEFNRKMSINEHDEMLLENEMYHVTGTYQTRHGKKFLLTCDAEINEYYVVMKEEK